MAMKSLHLVIDRIVVQGLPVSGQHRFVSVLQQRLRELAQCGIPEELARNTRKRIQSVNAGQLHSGAMPDEAALQVVNAIRQSLGANGGRTSETRLGRGGGEAQSNV
jgi:hypothetical protein